MLCYFCNCKDVKILEKILAFSANLVTEPIHTTSYDLRRDFFLNLWVNNLVQLEGSSCTQKKNQISRIQQCNLKPASLLVMVGQVPENLIVPVKKKINP